MAKVNDKSTKKDILNAYAVAMDEIKRLKSEKIDKRADVMRTRDVETVKVASSTSAEDIVKSLADLRLNANGVISNLEESILHAKSQLESINVAISVQQGELKAVHNVISEADSLAALIEANRAERDEFNIEMKEQRDEWEKEKLEKSVLDAEVKKNVDKDRIRRKEEFDYEFKLNVARQQDEFNDERSVLVRELATSRRESDEAFKSREEAVIGNEKELEALTMKVAEIPTLVENAKASATEEAKKNAERGHGFEVRAIKQQLETLETVSSNEFGLIKDQLNAAMSENSHLREQLIKANDKVTEVAREAIAGAQARIIKAEPQVVTK